MNSLLAYLNIHRFPENAYVQRTNLNRPADESAKWLSERAVDDSLHDALDEYVPHLPKILEDLPRRARAGIVHHDFFHTVRAQRLPSNYATEFLPRLPGQNRQSASAIHVHSGALTISTFAKDGTQTDYRLRAGDRHIFTDDVRTIVHSTEPTEILQIATPTQQYHRSLLCPTHPTATPIATREVKRDRAFAAWHAASRAVEHVAEVAASAKTRTRNLFWSANGIRPLQIMDVHAHPDDEVSKGAGTRAKLAKRGHEISVVFCTGGEQGSVLNPEFDTELTDGIASQRRQEAEKAAQILGHEAIFLDYADSGMPANNAPPSGAFSDPENLEQATEKLAVLIRERRPDIMIGYGPYNDNELAPHGAYTHLDHHAVHKMVHQAIDLAANSEAKIKTDAPPWTVPKVYEHVPHSLTHARWEHRAYKRRGSESPYDGVIGWRAAAKRIAGRKSPERTLLRRFTSGRLIKVRCARYAQKVEEAQRAHASQIGKVGALVMPREMLRVIREPARSVAVPQMFRTNGRQTAPFTGGHAQTATGPIAPLRS